MADKSHMTRRMLLGAALTGLVAGTVATAEARGRGGGGGFGGARPAPGIASRPAVRPAGTPTFTPGAGRLATGARVSGSPAICRRHCYRGCFYRR